MSYQLSARSISRLEGVHPDLVAIIQRGIAITPVDFTVLEGMRSRERQERLVARGASLTMNSRHLTGHAVDIAPWIDGGVSWHWGDFRPLAHAIKRAAHALDLPITWGGDWESFPDGAHFQLPWGGYPA